MDGTISVPKSYADALRSPQWQHWKEAISAEYQALIENGTWELVPRPKDAPVVGSRWVFTIKYDKDGNLSRYKARFVCKGFTQTEGIDYFDTYSPVVHITSLRMILALACKNDWDLISMDIKTAFLNAPVDETIYVQQPHGFVAKGKENYVLRLLRSLYGLKQAPRNFNIHLTATLEALGFQSCPADPCVFFHYSKDGKVCLVSVYVDDLVLTGNDIPFRDHVRRSLKESYALNDFGELDFILGMTIVRDRRLQSLRMHHGPYIKNLLTLFDISDVTYNFCTPAADDTYSQYLEAVFRGDTRTLDFDYRAVVGCLVYLTNTTRPDISNITRFLSGFVSNWTDIHVSFAKRVLKYLQLTAEIGLHYSFANGGVDCNPDFDITAGVSSFSKYSLVKELEAYTDASWADNYADSTSTSGLYIQWAGCLISWKSVKQKVIAHSSMESEFIAMAECVTELKRLIFLLENFSQTKYNALIDASCLEGLGYLEEAATVHINGDNTAAILVGNQDSNTKRSRMINTKFHIIKEAIVDKLVHFRYVASKENLADIFTKCLGNAPFLYLRKQFMA
jgi:hypothetical protein